jgi:hypothetical protein
MFPYSLCPGPLDPTDQALGWYLVLVSHMPYNFLASSIAFLAIIVMARPLFGARYPILGPLHDFYFGGPSKFAKLWSFDSLAQTLFVTVSVWQVFHLLW